MIKTFRVLREVPQDGGIASDESIKNVPDCNVEEGHREAAILHGISKKKFDLLIKYHFGNDTPVENIITREVIEGHFEADAGGVEPNHLEFRWDSATNEITCHPQSGTPAPGPNNVDYSVCLFKGILLEDDPETFHFYKAKYMDRDAVVFETMTGGTTINHYDLSNDIP